MASTLKHLRSSTADKRPTASGLADGQLAINTASGTPGLFFKDSNGGVVKVGPTHVGTSAPNAVPAGAAGNAKGELWVDENTTTPGLKYYSGSAFVNLTPSGTTDTIGLVELATPAETQAGSDGARAVTPSGLQSKISNSISTTSSTTIASSTAVKTAYDLANAALPKTGGTVAGEILISPSGSLAFEGSSDDTFQTTLAVTNPTADRTITFPNITGTVITTGDTSTVTSTMIADNTIVNADINASAAIAFSKLATGALPSGITVNSSNIVDGSIVNANISASAEIAVSKLANGAARQLLQTDAAGTGVEWASNIDIPGTLDVASAATFDSTISIPLASSGSPSLAFTGDPNTGIYSPGADQLAVATNGMGRLFVDASGNVGVGTILPEVNVDVASNVPTIQWRDLNGPANANRYRIGIDASQDFVFQAVTDAGVGGGSLWRFTRNGSEIENLIGNRAGTERLRLSNHDNKITFSNALGVLGTATAHDLQVLTNNAERARIDSSGRLLVGTSSTSASCTAAFQGNSGNTTGAAIFHLQRGLSSTGLAADTVMGRLLYGDNAGNPYAWIEGTSDAAAGTNDYPGRLVFATTPDGTNSPAERMRIDSAGQIKAASLGTAAAPVWSFTGDPNTGIYSPGTDQVAISTAGTLKLIIDGSGNITTREGGLTLGATGGEGGQLSLANPTNTNNVYTLDVVNDTEARLFTTTNNVNLKIGQLGGTGGTVQFLTGAAERARIDSSGRLLVGTSSDTSGGNGNALLQVVPSGPGRILSGRSDGNTTADQTIGAVDFRSFAGSVWESVATITAFSDGVSGSGDKPGRLVFSTTADGASSPAERMRIDSTGRLLVGTTTAVNVGGYGNADIQTYIQSNGAASSIAVISTGNNVNPSVLHLAKSRGGTSTIVNSGDVLGAIRFSGADGTDIDTMAAQIMCAVDGTPGANDMPGRLVFSTTADGASNPTERMRITQEGEIRIGTTTALDVGTGTDDGFRFIAPGTAAGIFQCSNNNNSVGYFRRRSTDGAVLTFRRDTTQVGTISVTTTATAYNTTSDYRLKENVVDLDDAVARLKQLPVHRFNFIADPDKTVDGFLAHEAAEVVPECVIGTKDEVDADGNPVYQGIDQSKLVPLLTAALQEAIAKIETLEAKVAALEAA